MAGLLAGVFAYLAATPFDLLRFAVYGFLLFSVLRLCAFLLSRLD
jgi:hypothetical protein